MRVRPVTPKSGIRTSPARPYNYAHAPLYSANVGVLQDSQHKFMAAVRKGDTEKVSKLTDKGLDPNFIDAESDGGL